MRGIHEQQDRNYRKAAQRDELPTPVMVFIEEVHEFLSAQRIRQMPVLFQQVARIARRGRKRWRGLAFVTQLPQHLPDEVLGLINNWVLHKISDANMVSRLRRSIGSDVMARKPITIRLDEEAELLEQAARIDAVSQNEFVRQAVLHRIAARKADPAFQAAVRRAVKANQRVFERLAQT